MICRTREDVCDSGLDEDMPVLEMARRKSIMIQPNDVVSDVR